METTSGAEPAIPKLERLSRTRLAECYQCGKCSAGCPMAGQMDIPPTRLIRLLQLGEDLTSKDVYDIAQKSSPEGEKARRIWKWMGAWTLNEVAAAGVAEGSRISGEVPSITLTEAIEVLECTEAGAASLRAAKWTK